jgi:hypothetical protein
MKNLPIVRYAKAGHPYLDLMRCGLIPTGQRTARIERAIFLGSLGRNSVGNC